MRQRVGEKKVKKYREKFGLPICSALVRGGTGHRIDLLIEGGEIVSYYPNTDELEIYPIKWNYSGWLAENPGIDCGHCNTELLDKLRLDAEKRKQEEDEKERLTQETIRNMEPWLKAALGYTQYVVKDV